MVLRLQGLPWDFRISAEVRSSILRYVKERIQENLADGDSPIVLLRLSYEGRLSGAPHSLALRIQLSVPEDVSDFAVSYLLDSLRQSKQEITEYLRRHALPLEITTQGAADAFAAAASLIQEMINLINENSADLTKRLKRLGEAFANVQLQAGEYKSELVLPMTLSPSASPAETTTEERTAGLQWWAWASAALVMCLASSCCGLWACRRLRKKHGQGKVVTTKEVRMLWSKREQEQGQGRCQGGHRRASWDRINATVRASLIGARQARSRLNDSIMARPRGRHLDTQVGDRGRTRVPLRKISDCSAGSPTTNVTNSTRYCSDTAKEVKVARQAQRRAAEMRAQREAPMPAVTTSGGPLATARSGSSGDARDAALAPQKTTRGKTVVSLEEAKEVTAARRAQQRVSQRRVRQETKHTCQRVESGGGKIHKDLHQKDSVARLNVAKKQVSRRNKGRTSTERACDGRIGQPTKRSAHAFRHKAKPPPPRRKDCTRRLTLEVADRLKKSLRDVLNGQMHSDPEGGKSSSDDKDAEDSPRHQALEPEENTAEEIKNKTRNKWGRRSSRCGLPESKPKPRSPIANHKIELGPCRADKADAAVERPPRHRRMTGRDVLNGQMHSDSEGDKSSSDDKDAEDNPRHQALEPEGNILLVAEPEKKMAVKMNGGNDKNASRQVKDGKVTFSIIFKTVMASDKTNYSSLYAREK